MYRQQLREHPRNYPGGETGCPDVKKQLMDCFSRLIRAERESVFCSIVRKVPSLASKGLPTLARAGKARSGNL